MTTEKLENYRALVDEVRDLEERRKRLSSGLHPVQDTVTGSSPTFPYVEHTIQIGGISRRQEEAMRKIDRLRRERMEQAQVQLAEIEGFISSITDAKMRRMVTLRYVDGLTWRQVAKRMYGSPYFEDTARMRVKRFLEKTS